MKIKTKLLLGFGLLFVVVVFFGIVSIYYIEDISEYSKTTVKNNYETLTFTRDMRAVIDENDLPLSTAASTAFDNALKKQEHNITEPGEKEATAGVRKAFNEIIDPGSALTAKQQAERAARFQLKTIEGLNMKAIVQKNNYIHDTVSKATFYLGGIVFVTFLILFVFIINFPGFILNPLNQFIDGVHDIREKNYDVRLEFKTGDEFAALAVEFNEMAANLGEQENKSLTKAISAENQVKILMEQMQAAVIGLSEKQEILFINREARKILKIDDKPVNGLPIHDVVKSSNLLSTILEAKDGERGVRLSLDGKASKYHIKKFEIVVPNLKPKPFDTLQFSGYTAGMIYLIKSVEQPEPDSVKPV
jgi:NtrC-family two-component system sensor histidine kinase KinB